MRRPDPGPRGSERGAALLTVLLMVAVISVLAATALERVHLSTRTAINAAAADQARAGAMAAETLALVRLETLLEGAPGRVALAGGWSDHPFALPIPGGVAVARVTDGGNCFNLNGLVTRAAPGVYAAAPARVAELGRLLRLTGTPAGIADQIAASAADWIDTDAAELPNGAEDGRYADGPDPYRTAGTLMADPSELRAVAGVTPAIYAAARPFLCTLPVASPTTLNVDTLLPEQAPLLAALGPDTLGVGQVQAALVARPPEGYADTAAFWRSGPLAGATAGEAPGRTAVVSRWFALRVDAQVGAMRVEERALIDATRLPPRLVSRQWGEPS